MATRDQPIERSAARVLGALARTPDKKLEEFAERNELPADPGVERLEMARDLLLWVHDGLQGEAAGWERIEAAWRAGVEPAQAARAEQAPATSAAPPSSAPSLAGSSSGPPPDATPTPAASEPAPSAPAASAPAGPPSIMPPPVAPPMMNGPVLSSPPVPAVVAPSPSLGYGHPSAPPPRPPSGGASPWAGSPAPPEVLAPMPAETYPAAPPPPADVNPKPMLGFEPPADAVDLNQTAPVGLRIDLARAPIPFSGRSSAPPPVPSETRRSSSSDGTRAMMSIVELAPALPFDGDGAPRGAALTLHQYASLCAECAVYPAVMDATYAKYGVTGDAERRALDGHWRERFGAEPGLKDEWQALVQQFQAWLASHHQG